METSKEMAKRVYLVHGWGGHPNEGWRPWLKRKLEDKGFEVFTPEMPDTDNPAEPRWVNFLAETVGIPNKDVYLVGHSLGAITILRYLEDLRPGQKIGGAIFVSGFAKDLEWKGYKGELASFFKRPFNWDKIKKHCPRFISIHSDNDPWVPLSNSEIFKKQLGARIIIMSKMKHFSGDDGITELPIVFDLICKRFNP